MRRKQPLFKFKGLATMMSAVGGLLAAIRLHLAM
jgi:hypothetical protein